MLSREELRKLDPSIRLYYKKVDLTTFQAFFDIIHKNQSTVKELIKNRYYFHLPTGWILSLEPNYIEAYKTYLQVCKTLYLHTFIRLLIERSKPETIRERLKYWLKKVGYRMVFCTHKADKRTSLLAIARHISCKPEQASSKETVYALRKAKAIARKLGLEYPNFRELDKYLLRILIKSDEKYLKKVKEILERIQKGTAPSRFIYKP